MVFGAGYFLYLLPLAGLPILFHFLLKQKRRQMIFSTLMFFQRTHPRLHARRRLRQLLILALRILLIALAILAIARPSMEVSSDLSGAGAAKAVVVVVDNSGSMSGATAEGKTKLDAAKEGADTLLAQLDADTQAALVLLVDDPAVAVDAMLTTDRDHLQSVVAEGRATQATGDAGAALARAFDLLSGEGGGGIVHVFTDLQRAEWDKDHSFSGVGEENITVYVHRTASVVREEMNAAIAGVQFPKERILPRHPYSLGVVLRNTSPYDGQVRVNTLDSQGRASTKQVALAKGRTRTVNLEVAPGEPGYRWIKAWIEGDGFAADNEAGIGIYCLDSASVLFAGERSEFGVLPVALSPSGKGLFTGLVPRYCAVDQLAKTLTDTRPILAAVGWQGLRKLNSAALEVVRQYVEGGGNLLVTPSLGNADTAGKGPDWLGAELAERKVYPQGVKAGVLDKRAGFWEVFRDENDRVRLGLMKLYAYFPLQLSKEFTPLLGADYQNVALGQRALGKGQVFVSGTAFDPRWNSLPHLGMLVVMAQRIALSGDLDQDGTMVSLVAGQQARRVGERIEEAAAGTEEVKVVSLVGDTLDWEGPASQMPAFVKMGVYLIEGEKGKTCVSVRASDREGIEQYIEEDEVPIIGRLAHKVTPYEEGEDFSDFQERSAFAKVRFYLPLLLLATLALLAEGLLANQSQRQRSSEEQLLGKGNMRKETQPGAAVSQVEMREPKTKATAL
jgi:aerotolerance regulator-like protein/VWA domain-containing protein